MSIYLLKDVHLHCILESEGIYIFYIVMGECLKNKQFADNLMTVNYSEETCIVLLNNVDNSH